MKQLLLRLHLNQTCIFHYYVYIDATFFKIILYLLQINSERYILGHWWPGLLWRNMFGPLYMRVWIRSSAQDINGLFRHLKAVCSQRIKYFVRNHITLYASVLRFFDRTTASHLIKIARLSSKRVYQGKHLPPKQLLKRRSVKALDKDNKEIEGERGALSFRANVIARRFAKCSER